MIRRCTTVDPLDLEFVEKTLADRTVRVLKHKADGWKYLFLTLLCSCLSAALIRTTAQVDTEWVRYALLIGFTASNALMCFMGAKTATAWSNHRVVKDLRDCSARERERMHNEIRKAYQCPSTSR